MNAVPTQLPRRRPVRLLVVTHTTGAWGAEQRLIEFMPTLIAAGVELTLASPGEGEFAKRFRAAGGSVLFVATDDRAGLRTPDGGRPGPSAIAAEVFKMVRSVWRLRRLARSHDVVQSHSRTAHLDVALLGRMTRRPTVLDLHDVIAPGVGRKVMAVAARLATVTVANSSSTRATLGDLDPTKVVVIHPAVDRTRFAPDLVASDSVRTQLGGRPGRPLLAILGRVDREKRIEVLLEAVGSMSRTDVDVVVVGSTQLAGDDYINELNQLALSAEPGRVHWSGARNDVPDVMAAVDVVVSTCPVEAFGRSLLEAQSVGIPVVAPDIEGVRDIVRHHDTGWLFAPDDAADLARVLTDVLNADRADDVRAAVGRALVQSESLGVVEQGHKWADVYIKAAARVTG